MSSVVLVGPRAIGIPTIPFNASDGGRTYPIQYLKSIIVDEAYTDWVDELGETLIPPTLHQFAGVFAGDFFDIWQIQNISQIEASSPQPHSVFLTISENYPYRYASGEQASEAYELEVTTGGIVIRGASPLGVWWGTRSLLHLSVLSDGNLPIGKSVDVPGWKIRGMMLDAGRHYYPSEVCQAPSLFLFVFFLVFFSSFSPQSQERDVGDTRWSIYVMLRCMPRMAVC